MDIMYLRLYDQLEDASITPVEYGSAKNRESTIMSLLEASCAMTSWRALLFRAILGIIGALIVCFDIWWFKQVNNSETCFGGHHCEFEQHVPCLVVLVCMNSVKFVSEAPGASILWGRYYSVTMCRFIWGALLLGRALLIGTSRYLWKKNIGEIWVVMHINIWNMYPVLQSWGVVLLTFRGLSKTLSPNMCIAQIVLLTWYSKKLIPWLTPVLDVFIVTMPRDSSLSKA